VRRLIVVSGIFGVLALFLVQARLAQRRIKAVKDTGQGPPDRDPHLARTTCAIVGASRVKVPGAQLRSTSGSTCCRSCRCRFPFTFVLAQLVVRYAYGRLQLHARPHGDAGRARGRRSRSSSRDAAARAGEISGATSRAGSKAVSPLVAGVPSERRAFQELVARQSGNVRARRRDPRPRARETKMVAAGEVSPRTLQPARGHGLLDALLWPAERVRLRARRSDRVELTYPDRDLGWLPADRAAVVSRSSWRR
jgi:hypothetical protein